MLTKLYRRIPWRLRRWWFERELKNEMWKVYVKAIQDAPISDTEMKIGILMISGLAQQGMTNPLTILNFVPPNLRKEVMAYVVSNQTNAE